MKIFVTGTRGIPDIPGGVEKHCEQLYPRIVAKGHEVLLARRPDYAKDTLTEWRGVQLVDCFAPKKKSLEAIVHTVGAIIQARKWGADVIHIHAIGPALVVPFARLLGMRVVFTNHGPDYDRQKWGGLAKFMLKFGEKLGGIFANEVVVISEVIREIIQKRCKRQSHLIYNGVEIPELTSEAEYLETLGVQPGSYIVAVARLVPEKGLHDLIDAFNQLDQNCNLVIAGDSDHADEYSEGLKEKAKLNPRIKMTGYITGEPLHQVFSNARLFVLPSYHEGLPIALLEALSYGLPSLVSDIPANLEVKLDSNRYFPCGDVAALKEKLEAMLSLGDNTQADKQRRRSWVQEKYNWDDIADEIIEVYQASVG